MIFPDFNPTNFSASMVLDHLSTIRDEVLTQEKAERTKALDFYTNNQCTDEYITSYGFASGEIPLQTINITSKVIDKISLLYKDAPDRGVKNYLKWTLQHKGFDVSLQEAEKYKNLMGEVLYRPWYVENIGWRYFIDYEFTPHYHELDALNPIAFTIPIKHNQTETNKTWIQQDWHMFVSAQHFFWFSMDAKSTIKTFDWAPKGEHNLGINPVVLLRKNFPVDQQSNAPANDLVQSNHAINIALNSLNLAIHTQAFDQPYTIGVPDEQMVKLKIGPTKLPGLPEGTDMKLLGYNPKLIEMAESIKFQFEAIHRAYNVNIDWAMSGDVSSGFALVVKSVDLMEARESDIPVAEMQEQNIYDVILAQQEKLDIPDETKLKKENLSLVFREINFPVSESEEQTKWDWEFKHNASTIIDYMVSKYGMDEKAAIKKLERNKKINQELSPSQIAFQTELDKLDEEV